MNVVEEILARKSVAILDGALATELEARGFNIDDELWSANALIEAPELIKAVHLDYLRAGADIITSASYQATVEGFMRRGLTHDEAVRLIKFSVELAKEAVKEYKEKIFLTHHPPTHVRKIFLDNARDQPSFSKRILAAASVGSYGAFLADGSEYRGDYNISYEQLKTFHRERLAILASAKPDIIAIETMPCLVEVKAIIEELNTYPELRAWVSFSCKDGSHISNGERIADCAAWLDNQTQVAAVGVNCTAPEYVEALIKEILTSTAKPVIVYPNSGEVFNVETQTWSGTPIDFAEYAKIWYEAGARIIGGCCRTTPQTIAAVKNCFCK